MIERGRNDIIFQQELTDRTKDAVYEGQRPGIKLGEPGLLTVHFAGGSTRRSWAGDTNSWVGERSGGV
jgi:hypothetical protein